MGSVALQAIVVSYILSVLHKSPDNDNFWILTNEAGIHLTTNNLLGDILIFQKSRLNAFEINTEYVKAPANVVLAVDTKADLSILSFHEYLKIKTTKLHLFGVDKIIWVLTASKQVVVAKPNEDWLFN